MRSKLLAILLVAALFLQALPGQAANQAPVYGGVAELAFPIESRGPIGVRVNFPAPYAAPPLVLVTPVGDLVSDDTGRPFEWCVYDVTADGFMIYARRSASYPVETILFHWLAVEYLPSAEYPGSLPGVYLPLINR